MILSIPEPVVGSYILVLVMLLFVHGVRMVAEEGLSYENGAIMGLGFWLGMGFQQKAIFNSMIPGWLAPILDNGMTSGTLVTLLLVGLLNLGRGRKTRLSTRFTVENLPEIFRFLQEFTERNGWNDTIKGRLQLVAEEIMLGLTQIRTEADTDPSPKFRIDLRVIDRQVEMDMAISSMEENIELFIDAAKASKQVPMDQLSFRILGKLADEVRHFQFHGLDFICVKVPID